jgi:hypothetical protein
MRQTADASVMDETCLVLFSEETMLSLVKSDHTAGRCAAHRIVAHDDPAS